MEKPRFSQHDIYRALEVLSENTTAMMKKIFHSTKI